jgi:hypothetical protein
MDGDSKAKFDVLEASGYTPVLREWAMNMSAPFWWHGENPGDYRILGNGTLFVVHTGKRVIGVTAAHVYRGWARDAESHRFVLPQFGGFPSNPLGRLIECNDKLDLATFLLSEQYATFMGRLIHHVPTWPPPPAKHGDIFLYGGFPGILKEVHKDNAAVDYPFQSFIQWRFADLTDQHIVLEPDYPNIYWPGHDGEQINTQPGGMSGGPVFRLIETSLPGGGVKPRLEVIGVIMEYHESLQIIVARRVEFIDARGMLAPGFGPSTYGPHAKLKR